MNSLVNLIRVPRMSTQASRLVHRFISTSKKNQEVCVTDADITQQEPVS